MRSACWKPQLSVRCSKASSSQEPVYLVRLRRFHRRLLHLARHPQEDQLRVRVHRDINYFHALLQAASAHFGGGSPHLWAVQALADFVGSAIEDEVQQLNEHRLLSWKARLALAPDKQRRWVKTHAGAHVKEMRAARPSPTLGGVQACAVHPAHTLRDLEDEWCGFWRQSPGSGTGRDFQELLRAVPTEVHLVNGIELSIDDLRSSMKAMDNKAAGPDDWSAAQLLRMGPRWWRCLTLLWNAVLRSGRIPDRWLESRVVFIPKPTTGLRPLAVASVLWRAGARAALRHLRPWIDSWASTRLFGGLPARGAEDALHWIYHGLSACHDNGVAVRQDIHRYFDSIDFKQAVAVLRHLRAPPAISGLLESFYSAERRIFAIGPHHGSSWQTGFTRGVLQGCPLSPLLGAAVMLPWLHHVCLPGVQVAVYMDDRVMWAHDPSFGPQLRQALHRTDSFDKVFGFRCRPSKCGTSAATPAIASAFGIDHFGYPFDTKFPVLGVVFDFQDFHNVTLLNFDLDLVLARVTDIARVVKAWNPRFALLTALVTPTFTWAAGVAQLPHATLPLGGLSLRSLVGRLTRCWLPLRLPSALLFARRRLSEPGPSRPRCTLRPASGLLSCLELYTPFVILAGVFRRTQLASRGWTLLVDSGFSAWVLTASAVSSTGWSSGAGLTLCFLRGGSATLFTVLLTLSFLLPKACNFRILTVGFLPLVDTSTVRFVLAATESSSWLR